MIKPEWIQIDNGLVEFRNFVACPRISRAIESAEALIGLPVAVQSMETNSVIV